MDLAGTFQITHTCGVTGSKELIPFCGKSGEWPLHHHKDEIVIAISKSLKTLRVAGFFACLAVSVGVASAQQPVQQPSAQTAPQKLPPMSAGRYIPPGYYPDANFYWQPSGRPPEVLRPLPPGYLAPPTGDLTEDCFVTPPKHFPICSRSCGCFSRWWATCWQEKQSFHMYIRGNGPAIHSRPASVWY